MSELKDLLYPNNGNDWNRTFFTCNYARYVRHGTVRGYRCMKNVDLFEIKYCKFTKPNKECPDWEEKE